jgi:hypothetical protein
MARRMFSARVAVVWYSRAVAMATAAYPAKVWASSTARRSQGQSPARRRQALSLVAAGGTAGPGRGLDILGVSQQRARPDSHG